MVNKSLIMTCIYVLSMMKFKVTRDEKQIKIGRFDLSLLS